MRTLGFRFEDFRLVGFKVIGFVGSLGEGLKAFGFIVCGFRASILSSRLFGVDEPFPLGFRVPLFTVA